MEWAPLDELVRLLIDQDLAVSIDGFGDDPSEAEKSVRLYAARGAPI